jgi:O-antigen/teichoic acid export membrane protein
MAQMGLRKSALALAMASAMEYGLQLAVPVVLVRILDPITFGSYKLLWLLAATALAWLPFFMPQGLFYFLPRNKSHAPELISNALVYLFFMGVLAAVVGSNANPFLPEVAQRLNTDSRHLSSIFVGLSVALCIFDVLPTAIEKFQVQAATTAGLAVLRSAILVVTALFSPSLVHITLALVCTISLKAIALFAFIRAHPELTPMRTHLGLFRQQIVYAAPFAVGRALFLMRLQADQWIVAASVDTATYAVFSIASVLGSIGTLIRQPVHNAISPKINAAYAGGNSKDAATLIGNANTATSIVLIPVIGGLFASAPELVTFVYTASYSGAAPVMQIYLIGVLANSFAVGYVLPALDLGKFATLNSAVFLGCSALISYLGLKSFGLSGAALGSVLVLYVGELWAGVRVAKTLGVSWSFLFQSSSLYRCFIALVLGVASASILVIPHSYSAISTIAIKSSVFSVVYLLVFGLLGGRRDLKVLLGKESGKTLDVGA